MKLQATILLGLLIAPLWCQAVADKADIRLVSEQEKPVVHRDTVMGYMGSLESVDKDTPEAIRFKQEAERLIALQSNNRLALHGEVQLAGKKYKINKISKNKDENKLFLIRGQGSADNEVVVDGCQYLPTKDATMLFFACKKSKVNGVVTTVTELHSSTWLKRKNGSFYHYPPFYFSRARVEKFTKIEQPDKPNRYIYETTLI